MRRGRCRDVQWDGADVVTFNETGQMSWRSMRRGRCHDVQWDGADVVTFNETGQMSWRSMRRGRCDVQWDGADVVTFNETGQMSWPAERLLSSEEGVAARSCSRLVVHWLVAINLGNTFKENAVVYPKILWKRSLEELRKMMISWFSWILKGIYQMLFSYCELYSTSIAKCVWRGNMKSELRIWVQVRSCESVRTLQSLWPYLAHLIEHYILPI
jgi:hypothetical protein